MLRGEVDGRAGVNPAPTVNLDMCHATFAQDCIVFDMLKRRMTGLAVKLYGQKLLAEQRKKFGLG